MSDESLKYDETQFYERARRYWSTIPATLEGVLGGYESISEVDLEMSKKFLQVLFSSDCPPGRVRALDCGAGIGRITQNVLIPNFEKVDLVEQDKKFLDKAIDNIGIGHPRLGAFYYIGLQYFKPTHKYDIIWCQWVLGHLKDYDLVNFLKQCACALNENGLIVIKENITFTSDSEYDEEDSSVTRSLDLMAKIFDKANYECTYQIKQPNFPEELYDVYLFAIKPKQ